MLSKIASLFGRQALENEEAAAHAEQAHEPRPAGRRATGGPRCPVVPDLRHGLCRRCRLSRQLLGRLLNLLAQLRLSERQPRQQDDQFGGTSYLVNQLQQQLYRYGRVGPTVQHQHRQLHQWERPHQHHPEQQRRSGFRHCERQGGAGDYTGRRVLVTLSGSYVSTINGNGNDFCQMSYYTNGAQHNMLLGNTNVQGTNTYRSGTYSFYTTVGSSFQICETTVSSASGTNAVANGTAAFTITTRSM